MKLTVVLDRRNDKETYRRIELSGIHQEVLSHCKDPYYHPRFNPHGELVLKVEPLVEGVPARVGALLMDTMLNVKTGPMKAIIDVRTTLQTSVFCDLFHSKRV